MAYPSSLNRRAAAPSAFSTITPNTTTTSQCRHSSKRPLLASTLHLLSTYQSINPRYKFYLPRGRVLCADTWPCVAFGPRTNKNGDFICCVRDKIVGNAIGAEYEVIDKVGAGTFGQVFKCIHTTTSRLVCIKVLSRKIAYKAIPPEPKILERLTMEKCRHIVAHHAYFVFEGHHCIVMDCLGSSLYSFIELRKHIGLPLKQVVQIARQLLEALVDLKRSGVTHTDIKLENICCVNDKAFCEFVLVDFGSSICPPLGMVAKTNPYIQSRFYRAPEVILDYDKAGYGHAIDIWSFGCVIFELFAGLPLFPGLNELDMMSRMIGLLGQPHEDMLTYGLHVSALFYKIHHADGGKVMRLREAPPNPKRFHLYPPHLVGLDAAVWYVHQHRIEKYHVSSVKTLGVLSDFLSCALKWHPNDRATPEQLLQHSFLSLFESVNE